MNKSSVVLALPNVFAVSCVFPKVKSSGSYDQTKVYTYKTNDASLKEGDLVIVENNNEFGFSIAKVVKTKVVVDLENTTIRYKWIASKIDFSKYTETKNKEDIIVSAIEEHEDKKAKENLLKKFDLDRNKIEVYF